jgi:hypothetical protein
MVSGFLMQHSHWLHRSTKNRRDSILYLPGTRSKAGKPSAIR